MPPPLSLPRAADLDLDDIPYVEGMAISCMPPAAEYFEDPMWYDSGGRDPLVQREIFELDAGEERTRRLKGIVEEYRLYGPMLYELAAEIGRVDVVRLLLELGADPNVHRMDEGSGVDGTPPTDEEGEDQEEAMNLQDDARVQDATESAADEPEGEDEQNANAGISASGGEDLAAKSDDETLQDEGEAKDGSIRSMDSDSDDFERTPMLTLHPPLTGAAFAGQLESVKVLLDEVKVSIDEYDENGPSIGYAAAAGHAEVVKFLLSRGAAIVTKPDSPDVLSLALKGGNIAAVNAILESEQWRSAGREVTIDHLPFAGHGGNQRAVELILSLCRLPPPTGNITDLTDEQSGKILEAITEATTKSALACLHPMLAYVTHRQPDGSYAYFEGRDGFEIAFFNATEDAIDIADNPELFQLAWDTILRRPSTGPEDLMARTPFDVNGKPNITNHEAIHRHLIAAAGHGRLETVKVMCEHCGVDFNHVSHKIFSTPLSRAAGQGLYDLQARLSVARYLLEHTNVDASIAHGDFANGTTPLACAMDQRQPEMIRLLLEFGGPVDSIDEKVRRRVERRGSGEQVKICVVYFPNRPRCDVRIMTKKAFHAAANEERAERIMLEWEKDELLSVLARLRIRAPDEELQKADPKGRPLAEVVSSSSYNPSRSDEYC